MYMECVLFIVLLFSAFLCLKLFEMKGVPENVAKEAMRLAGNKLPIKTKFVVRESEEIKEEGGEG